MLKYFEDLLSRAKGRPIRKFSQYAPLRTLRDQLVHEVEEKVMRVPPTVPHRPLDTKICSLHGECAHSTSECRKLKRAHFIQGPSPSREPTKRGRGRGLPWMNQDPRTPTHSNNRDPRSQKKAREYQSHRERFHAREPSSTCGTIKMISGGYTDGDSNRARKALCKSENREVNLVTHEDSPVISFSPKDLDGVNTLHNDALIIQAKVANYEIQMVFVDSRRSVNVIF